MTEAYNRRPAEERYAAMKLDKMNAARQGVLAGRSFFEEQGVARSLVDIVAERVARAAGDEFEQSLLQDPLVVIRSAIDAAVAQGSEVQGRIAAKAHEQVGWFEEEWRELLDRSQQFARQTGGGFDLGRVFQDQFGRSTSNAYVRKNERGQYGIMARLVDRLHIEADPTITRDEADQYAISLLVELGAPAWRISRFI